MLFSSPSFFLFFVAYFAFHLYVPRQYRSFLIICGSTIFFAWWRIEYIWLPYLLMAIAFGGVSWMEGAGNTAGRRRRMAVTIIALFLPLLVFKYANFAYANVFGPVFSFRVSILDLPIPLGISFITFTLAAYIVDIYRGAYPSGQTATTLLSYVLFFPHLIAGPILRPVELIPQLERPRVRLSIAPKAAIAIFTLGLVKKLVLADPIADVVDTVYASGNPSGPGALLAIYGFSVQIYCDFSGYTDMAIGLAMLLGVRLPNNFYRPYAAVSLVDFWRRWHVTLSFWFRDYVYVPLGGNRGGLLKEVRNILVTMMLAGLWHGANWTFVIWGLLHGLAIAAQHILHRWVGRGVLAEVPHWLSVLFAFHFVTLAWVLFRAPNLSVANIVLRAPFAGGGWNTVWEFAIQSVFPIVLIGTFFATHRFDDHLRIKLLARRVRSELFWPIIILGWVLAITVSHGNSAKFIYFDF